MMNDFFLNFSMMILKNRTIQVRGIRNYLTIYEGQLTTSIIRATIIGSSTKIKDGANFQMYAVNNRYKMVVDHHIIVEQ